MRWYTGGIAEAISISKAKGALFVVYIEGKDEQSKSITQLIDNSELGEKLQSEHFVAVKIEANSVPHQQFSEIYKEPKVPSLYFIGKNGATLDIITEADDVQSLSKRVDDTLHKAGISAVSSAGAFSQNLILSEQATPPSSVFCENGVCSINKGDLDGTSKTSEEKETVVLTPEERVDRARELLQKKREEKEKEEKENERLKEIERRKIGQNVQHLKKWQEDQELKQLLEKREKEKRENQLARERVLAQIAQDKAERLSKTRPAPAAPTPQVVPGTSRSNTNTTRLQFKLPNGSTSTQEFSNFDSLQTVVTYIKTNMNLPFPNFRLSTSFPRREFTENDYSQTLADLQLTPTAVILILPITSGTLTTSAGGGTITNLVWTLFAPFIHIFGFLRNFIFGTPTNVVGNKKPADEPSTSFRPENPRPRSRDSTVVKKQGNVHRLSDKRDSDDDLNTWNGNSTQQM